MPNYEELKKLNDSAFSDNPVASAQARPVTKLPELNIKGFDPRNAGNSSLFDNISQNAAYIDQNRSIASPFASDYFNTKIWGVDIGSVTNKHKDIYGGVNPYSKAVDFENLRRNEQSNFSAGLNLFNQYVGKTAINTIGGIVGGFYSLGSAVANGDASKLYDNSVNRAFDKGTDWVEQNNSVFTSQRARDTLGFFSFETVKDFSDAYSFISGAVASELIIEAGTGGLGLAGIGGRMARSAGLVERATARAGKAVGLGKGIRSTGNFISRSEDIARLISSVDPSDVTKLQQIAKQTGMAIEDLQRYRKTVDQFNNVIRNGRQLVTGTFWEAGLEARHTKDQLMSSQMDKLEDFIASSNMSDEEKQAYRAKETKRITDVANTAGVWTFGLNSAVLGASNYIQFPTIFGPKELSRANRMTGQITRQGIGNYIKQGGKLADIAKTTVRALKSPLTEFTEETLQGAINIGSKSYYESMLGTRTSNGEILPSIANLSDSVAKGLSETYGTKEGINEGIIGALVGAIGLPVLRRNKAGKLRPQMTGGIFESVQDLRTENNNIRESIQDLNLNDFDTLLNYNKDNAILASIDSKKQDVANLAGDKFEIERLNDNKVFRHVRDRLDKGLESYMNDDVSELQNMSLEEYKSRFSKEQSFSEEQKRKEVNDFSSKVDIYSKAYKKVYEGLEMDRINNNSISKKLFDTLTYAVANEKIYGGRQKELMDKILSNPSIDLDYQELLQLATLDSKFKPFENDVEDYIKDRKDREFNTRKENINNRISKLKDKVSPNNQVLLNEVLEDKEDTKDYLQLLIKLQKEFDSDTYKDLAAQSEDIFDVSKDIATLLEEANKLEQNKDKLSKFNPDKSKTVRSKRKNTQEALESIKSQIQNSSSKSLEILRGKKDTLTENELKSYIDLKARATEAVNKSKNINRGSFLDQLDTNNEDIQDMFDELSNITKHQTMALDIATNLYGLGNKAYGKIVQAEFEENLFNLKDDMFEAISAYTRADDENYISEIAANLQNSIFNLEQSLEEYGDALNEKYIERINGELETAKDVLNTLNEYLNLQDTKEEVAKQTIAEDKREEEKQIINNIETSEKTKEENIKNTDNLLRGVVSDMEFDNGKVSFLNNKNLHTITPANENNANGIKAKIDSGEIKYNSGAVASYLEYREDTEGFRDYIQGKTPSQPFNLEASYNRGKEKIQSNPELLKYDIDSMDTDVKIFAIHAPVNVDIYNKEVEISEGVQEFFPSEDDTIAHKFLYYAPRLINTDQSNIDKYNNKKEALDKALKSKLNDIDDLLKRSKISSEEYNKRKAIFEKQYNKDLSDVTSSAIISENNINDKVLFNFRQSLLYSNYADDTNELKLRVGNIINGYLEKVGDTTFEVEENALVGDENNNNLVNNINDITANDILFGNQSGEYISFNGKKVKLNRGSKVEKVNAHTGKLYFRYKTVNHQEIPLMLNRTKLVNSPVVYVEVIHQIQEYLNSKNPNETIILQNNTLSFVKGKSFKEFFATFLKEKNNSSDPSVTDTFTINDTDKSIYFGKLDLPIDSIETFEANKTLITDTLINMRYHMNQASFRKDDGSFDKEFLEFVVSNKLINHSFNSKDNIDRIFTPNDSTGESFNKAIQLHIINSEVKRIGETKNEEFAEDTLDNLTNNLLSKFEEPQVPQVTSEPVVNTNRTQKSMSDELFSMLNPGVSEEELEASTLADFEEPEINELESDDFSPFVLNTDTLEVSNLEEEKSDDVQNESTITFINNTLNDFEIKEGSLIIAEAPFRKGTISGKVKLMEINPLKEGLYSIILDNGEKVVYNKNKSKFTWIQNNNIQENTTPLTFQDKDYISGSRVLLKSIFKDIKSNPSEYPDAIDYLKDFRIGNYNNMIEALNIVYNENSDELKKMITFANKLYNREDNNFNC